MRPDDIEPNDGDWLTDGTYRSGEEIADTPVPGETTRRRPRRVRADYQARTAPSPCEACE